MSNYQGYTRGSGLLEKFLAKKRAEMANSLIPKGSKKERILDAGCGSYPYFLLSTQFKEKYGIDPSVNLSSIKDNNIFLRKTRIDDKSFPYDDNFFDAVTMLAVFEHIDHEKLVNVLKEVKRVLKKEGIFIITTPAPWSDKLLHFMARVGLISKEEIHEHKHNHSGQKIINILEKAGFEKDKIKSGFFEIFLNMWFTAKK